MTQRPLALLQMYRLWQHIFALQKAWFVQRGLQLSVEYSMTKHLLTHHFWLIFFLFKLLVLQNQLFRWERLPTLTVNWNKFCIFTHLILRNPCCNVAQVKYGKNHNYFDLIFFLILETNMKIMSKMSQSLETSDLWPTVTWLGWNRIQTVLVQHWTNLQFS